MKIENIQPKTTACRNYQKSGMNKRKRFSSHHSKTNQSANKETKC